MSNTSEIGNTFGQQRCVAKTYFENNETPGTPGVSGHDPIFWMMLEALRFVFVPGNGLEHEQFEHKQY